MKKLICILLVFALLFSGCGKKQTFEKPVQFYYPKTELSYGANDSIFALESAEGSGYEDDLTGLLNIYVQGPRNTGMRRIFPAGLKVTDLQQKDGILKVILSDEIARLTGLELTIACACLSLTCMELTDAVTVEISAETMLLDGAEVISMNKDRIHTLDAPVGSHTEETTQ